MSRNKRKRSETGIYHVVQRGNERKNVFQEDKGTVPASCHYFYNGHADVTALVNASTGLVAGTYYYDAFGACTELQVDMSRYPNMVYLL